MRKRNESQAVALPTEPRWLIIGVAREYNINVAVCSNNHGIWERTSDMEEVDLNTIILDFLHSETGWGNPLRPNCEFEELTLGEIERLLDDKIRVTFRYHFDEDGFSQYDKTHVLDGDVIIDVSGEISEFELKEIHTGVASNIAPYRPQSH